MNEILKEAFEYHHFFNQKFIAKMMENYEQLPVETFPLFCHVLNAHQIWISRILHTTAFTVKQLHDITDCPQIDRENFHNSIRVVEEFNLNEMLSYTNSSGESFSNKISDILFHVINHSTHHKAQISSQFRQAGIEPLITDYIFYKRK